MIVRIITCRVKPGSEAEFGTSGTYYLHEVYRDDAATVAHKETTHYTAWREAVAGLMAADRSSVACSVVAPEAESDW